MCMDKIKWCLWWRELVRLKLLIADWLKKWIKFLDLQVLDTMKIENSRKIQENERNVKKIFREKTSLECRSLLWMDFSYGDLFKLHLF